MKLRRGAAVSRSRAGCSTAAAFPPADLGWVAFVALVPLLPVALRSARHARGRTFLLGWLAGTIACALLVSTSIVEAATRYFGLPPGAAWLAGVLAPQLYGAPYFGLFAGSRCAIWRRRHRATPLRCAPGIAAAWVACDLLRSRLGDGCPWVLLAHSQHAHPTLLQIADLGGAAAVSFVVALVNAALALAVLAVRAGTCRDGPRALAGSVAARSCWSSARPRSTAGSQLARWSDAARRRRCASPSCRATCPTPGATRCAISRGALRRLQELTRAGRRRRARSRRLARERGQRRARRDPDADSPTSPARLPAGALLLVGAPRAAQIGPGRAAIYNAAFLIDGDGSATPVYDKLYLTPWAEGAPWPLGSPARPLAADARQLLARCGDRRCPSCAATAFGVAICSEAIYAGAGRATRSGAARAFWSTSPTTAGSATGPRWRSTPTRRCCARSRTGARWSA